MSDPRIQARELRIQAEAEERDGYLTRASRCREAADEFERLADENTRLLQGYMPDSAWQELLDNALAELARRDEEFRQALALANRWEVKYKACVRDMEDAQKAHNEMLMNITRLRLDPQIPGCTCSTYVHTGCPIHGYNTKPMYT